MDEKKDTFYLDGKIVGFTKITYQKPIIDEGDRVCPLCGKGINVGQKVVICISNYVLFPNTIIHNSCTSGIPNKVTAIVLRDKWKEAKKHVKLWGYSR